MISLKRISCAIFGQNGLGSIWLRDSKGLSEDNLLILQEGAAIISQIRGPWILGGDWNLIPQALQSTNWLTMVGGVIVAPYSTHM